MTKDDLTTMTKSQWALEWLQPTEAIRKCCDLWWKIRQGSRRCGSLPTGCLKNGSHVWEEWSLCLSWKKRKKSSLLQYTQGPWLSVCWWESNGGREHRCPCLIRFHPACIQPEGGWMCCANKVDIHQCCQSHRTWLSYTPCGCSAGVSVTLAVRANRSTECTRTQRSGGVGLCFSMNIQRGQINI